jgi:hypothetical protein
MGLLFYFALNVGTVVNFVGLCSVLISFIRCRTIPGYRNIAILAAIYIPTIILSLTFVDASNNQPTASPDFGIEVMLIIVWSKTFLICFLGACATATVAFFKSNAISCYSGLSWGFLISSLSASVFLFIKSS